MVVVDHVEGTTEPWVQDLLCSLLNALQRPRPTVLELGGFQGHTSARLAHALEAMGGGELIVAEWDAEAPERADQADTRIGGVDCPNVRWRVVRSDALTVIRSLDVESVDFAYLDDDHAKDHVREEIAALISRMRPGGLITGHDVYGSCDLQALFHEYGGYALDLPRLGPAGGLGILQV